MLGSSKKKELDLSLDGEDEEKLGHPYGIAILRTEDRFKGSHWDKVQLTAMGTNRKIVVF